MRNFERARKNYYVRSDEEKLGLATISSSGNHNQLLHQPNYPNHNKISTLMKTKGLRQLLLLLVIPLSWMRTKGSSRRMGF